MAAQTEASLAGEVTLSHGLGPESTLAPAFLVLLRDGLPYGQQSWSAVLAWMASQKRFSSLNLGVQVLQ